MGRGSPIPPMLRRKIVEQYQKGVSQRKIAKSLKLSSSTVHNIIQRFRESGTISVRKGQGRKTILDARDLRAFRRHCITYRNATVMEITTWAQEYFQKTLSVNTIHRAIRRCRLKLYRSKKKPYLNMIQKRRRFLWAKAHLKWTAAKWKTVLWSDESKFEVLFGKLGRHVIRTKEDKDNPSYYQRSVQKPASLMHPPPPYLGLPYTLFLRMCDLADTHYTMERRDRRAHGFGVAGRRPLHRSLRRCFESARLLRFVAELSHFLSDVLDNLPALAEASPLQSGPDDVPDPGDMPDVPDLADEPEPDALNLAGHPSPSLTPSSPSFTSSFPPVSPSYFPTSPTAHLADISAEE
ncbi:hypothetical protein QTP70_007008 [Hemibagrus guttatus]|uniref:Paired domain-containing protein n=1 Tax=Hemibagrus guttatus TaxID=175788 RepID=A0AAE0Q7D8_9TELE|nr:hypothetical protein QTP70_007008 [Hemibagrus guttatus]